MSKGYEASSTDSLTARSAIQKRGTVDTRWVDVFLNPRAGRAHEQQLRKSLLRLATSKERLIFHSCPSIPEMHRLLAAVLERGTDGVVIGGGDGTLNQALSVLMTARRQKHALPPLTVVPCGTANDLASEMKLPSAGALAPLWQAARADRVRLVDVLEAAAGERRRYMLTNGGLGVAARTARRANVVRRRSASARAFAQWWRRVRPHIMRALGAHVYELCLIQDLWRTQLGEWHTLIEIAGKPRFESRAPFVMVNNQSTIGGTFRCAPGTRNDDGAFNVMLVNEASRADLVGTLVGIRLGRPLDLAKIETFETTRVVFRAPDAAHLLTFFGDGEVLHRRAQEISVRCLSRALPVVTPVGHVPAQPRA